MIEDKFISIIHNEINGNIRDYKNILKKMSVRDRADFVEWLWKESATFKDIQYFTTLIITKDW